VSARFAVGDAVRTGAPRADGHTRLPRYLGGRRGTIEAVHGPFALPDENARGARVRETLYTVVFDGTEVFGAEAERPLSIAADLFESYLEAAR
jgi:nitrile hydratase subunit beta